MLLAPIGHIESPYLTKFGVPRQPGLADALESSVRFEPACFFREETCGLACDDWIVLIWSFSHNLSKRDAFTLTVRPPLLGGTQRMGVFATRSSFRPNGLALSCVQVTGTCKDSIRFRGGDMVDGTPVYRIRRYDRHCDAVPEARTGWTEQQSWPRLEAVEIPDNLASMVPEPLRAGLIQVLMQDPRPAYTRLGQEGRVFWTALGTMVIRFSVEGAIAHVLAVEVLDADAAAYLKKTGNLAS